MRSNSRNLSDLAALDAVPMAWPISGVSGASDAAGTSDAANRKDAGGLNGSGGDGSAVRNDAAGADVGRIPVDAGAFILTGEMAALVLEAGFFYAAARPRDLARAVTASALANGLSFGAGLLLWGAAF